MPSNPAPVTQENALLAFFSFVRPLRLCSCRTCTYLDSILFLILPPQMPPEHTQEDNDQPVASHVNRETRKVPWGVFVLEHLGSDHVAHGPGHEQRGRADGLLRLASHVPRQHAHQDDGCSPEGEREPVREQEADPSGLGDGNRFMVLVTNNLSHEMKTERIKNDTRNGDLPIKTAVPIIFGMRNIYSLCQQLE